jgi:hypothetical protein
LTLSLKFIILFQYIKEHFALPYFVAAEVSKTRLVKNGVTKVQTFFKPANFSAKKFSCVPYLPLLS